MEERSPDYEQASFENSIPTSITAHDDFKELVIDLVGRISVEIDIKRKLSNLESLISISLSQIKDKKIKQEALEELGIELPHIRLELDYQVNPNMSIGTYRIHYKTGDTDVSSQTNTEDVRFLYDRIELRHLNDRCIKLWIKFQEILEHLIIEEVLPWELKETYYVAYPTGEHKILNEDKELEGAT